MAYATVVLRPDSTPESNGTFIVRTGGTTFHGVLADDSDATYNTINNYATSPALAARMTFSDLGALPAGAVIRQVRYGMRAKTFSAFGGCAVRLRFGTSGPTIYYDWYPTLYTADGIATYWTSWRTTLADGTAWRQDFVDGTNVRIYAQDSLSSYRLYELYAEVQYDRIPVVTATGPTGVVTGTTNPYLTWTYSDPDGEASGDGEIVVVAEPEGGWTGGDFGGGTIVWQPLIVKRVSPVQVGVPLQNLTNYRFYIRQTEMAHPEMWSDWSYTSFSLDLNAPSAPSVLAVPDDANAKVNLFLSADPMATYYATVAYRDAPSDPWTPVRGTAGLTVGAGRRYVTLDGASGTFVDAPPDTALQGIGTSLRVDVIATRTGAAANYTLLARDTGTASSSQFDLVMTSGNFLILYVSNGTTRSSATSTAAVATPTARHRYTATWRSSDGRVQFFVDGVQLGTNLTVGSGWTLTGAGTTPLRVGAYGATSTGSQRFIGQVEMAQVGNISSVVGRFDALSDGWTDGQTSPAARTSRFGHTFTLANTAVIASSGLTSPQAVDWEAPLYAEREYQVMSAYDPTLDNQVASPPTYATAELEPDDDALAWLTDPTDPASLNLAVCVAVEDRERAWVARDVVHRPAGLPYVVVESDLTNRADNLVLVARDYAEHEVLAEVMAHRGTLLFREAAKAPCIGDRHREHLYFRWVGDRTRTPVGELRDGRALFSGTAVEVAVPS
jgi:hypothetical protein